MEENNTPLSEPNKTSSTSIKTAIGGILIFVGLLFSLLIAVFYLQVDIPISHKDFAGLIVAIQLEVIGLAILLFKRK
ncbi:MAG: hypothetical protein ACQCN3_08200 [Candidatus Bathyarchaeia archaeon]